MDKTTYGQSKVMGFDPKVINLVLSYSVVTSHAFTSLWCFFTFTVRILSCTAFSCLVRCPFEVTWYSHSKQDYHVYIFMSTKMIILSYSVVTSSGCVSSWCFFTFTVRIPSCTAFSCSSRCPFEFARYSHRSQGHTFFHSSSVDSEDLLCCWLLVTFRARLSCVYFNFY